MEKWKRTLKRKSCYNDKIVHGREVLKKAIVVYDSLYGNTEKVARALAQGLESGEIKTDLIQAGEIDVNRLQDYDLVLVGSPTHAWRPSKLVKEFLGRINESALSGKKAFAFDTKLSSRLAGSAAKHIEKALSKQGAEIVRVWMSAIVTGREGPLEEGTEKKFKDIGFEIAELI